ncbi:protein BCAP-like isoform X2 [Physella acuta]|uniref:protein BCAP-like isoform X2 n=1 Tax=Physella acuta TaxID=109671 RepID=UPI0027DE6331|nr:protein BCAP-like isoform X2 [Physella acuta]
MRLRVQVKYVTEHMNYLEEKIHVMKPVVEALQGAVDKSKTWLEDKSDNESLTYCDLCQELESATLALLDKATHILGENKESVEDGRSFSSQSTSQTTATEECGSSQSTDQVLNELYKPSEILSRLEQIETAISSLQDVSRLEQIETAISSLQDVSRLEQIETAISSLQDVSRLEQIETAISSLQDVSRLEQIETAISSLQDVSRLEQIETAISSLQDVSRLEQIETAISSLQDVSRLEQIETAISSLQDVNDKSTDDISEIKQWRDNFVTEQSDIGVIIEQLTKKQKQNFKTFRKQMNEQDNIVKALNKENESLKEKETSSNKTLEKLSLGMKEYENNLLEITKKMQNHTDKTESITQEIKSYSDLIVSLQEDYNKTRANVSTKFEKLQFKHNLMYQLLQQKLMPIDRLFQIFNKSLVTREERSKKLETMENVMSKLTMDFNVIESRVCNRYACIAQLANPTPVSDKSIISTFSEVREYNGQHFNQTTGTFVSPHDGLYLVCVTLHECGHKLIGVTVMAGGRLFAVIDVKSNRSSAAGSVVVDMKKGEELFFKVYAVDPGAMLSSFSSFTIVSL